MADASVPAPPANVPAGAANTIEFTSYAPKRITFKAQAATPAVLLLNDHYDPNWKVFVDGKPAPLLRCNYLMRGTYLLAGTHNVEFRFAPPYETLYVSLVAVAIGLVLIGFLVVNSRK